MSIEYTLIYVIIIGLFYVKHKILRFASGKQGFRLAENAAQPIWQARISWASAY